MPRLHSKTGHGRAHARRHAGQLPAPAANAGAGQQAESSVRAAGLPSCGSGAGSRLADDAFLAHSAYGGRAAAGAQHHTQPGDRSMTTDVLDTWSPLTWSRNAVRHLSADRMIVRVPTGG